MKINLTAFFLLTLLCCDLLSNEIWKYDISNLESPDGFWAHYMKVYPGDDGSALLWIEPYPSKYGDGHDIYIHWFDKNGKHLQFINTEFLGDESVDSGYDPIGFNSQNLVIEDWNWGLPIIHIIKSDGTKTKIEAQASTSKPSFTNGKFVAYVSNDVLHVISIAGTSTSSSNNSETNGNSSTIKYDELKGWCHFDHYPWVYSNQNKSWYYLSPVGNKLFAYNENISGNKWIVLEK